MRALLIAGGATMIAACSLGALDGYSGQEVPDGGSVGDATIADSSSSSPDVAQQGDSSVEGSPATSAYHLAVKADGPVAHFALEETSGAACASRTTTSAVCVYPPDQITRGQPGIGGTKAIRLDANTS